VRLVFSDAENNRVEVLLPINDMTEARLVLTDSLIAESLRKGKQNQRKETA
jgi:ribosome maturation factor RimP